MMREGLNRHDAIHSVGSILAEQIWGVMKGDIGDDGDPNAAHAEELSKTNAPQETRGGDHAQLVAAAGPNRKAGPMV